MPGYSEMASLGLGNCSRLDNFGIRMTRTKTRARYFDLNIIFFVGFLV